MQLKITGRPLSFKGTYKIVIYVDFHSAKRASWLVDSWSRAPDQIQMYPDRDTIEQLLSARRTWSVHD